MASAYRVSPGRRRPVALLLALVAHALVIWVLLWLAPVQTPPQQQIDLSPKTFSLDPAPVDVARPTLEKAVAPAARTVATARAKPPAAVAATVPRPSPQPVAVPTPTPLMAGGMELFDAADIGKLGHPDDATEDADDAKSASVYGPGEGPGGERMYDAQLLNAPTWSQIAGYMPNRKPVSGFAIIGCRVGDNNTLENCRQLAESPPGTGLARAIRQAAWQFRIIPPRIGKRRLNFWVRVKVTFTDLGAP